MGYREIYPLGGGRLFPITVSVTGLASLFYLFTAAVDRLVSLLNELRETRSMQEAIAKLNDHIILAGLGRMGRRAAELAVAQKAFVVIDEEGGALQLAQDQGYLYVEGEVRTRCWRARALGARAGSSPRPATMPATPLSA